jgi:hypothetical protein
MFLKNVKCIPTKCKPTFGPPCIQTHTRSICILAKQTITILLVLKTFNLELSQHVSLTLKAILFSEKLQTNFFSSWNRDMLQLSVNNHTEAFIFHKVSWFMVLNATFNNISGGGNQSTQRKPPTNFITYCCIEYTSQWTGFELTTLVVISTNCTGCCNSNYHTITTTTAPALH